LEQSQGSHGARALHKGDAITGLWPQEAREPRESRDGVAPEERVLGPLKPGCAPARLNCPGLRPGCRSKTIIVAS
jgi:hypothetical protein